MEFSENVMTVSHTLHNAGFQALIAGGFVRNTILGLPVKDVDFATDATPDRVETLFHKTIPVGKEFGVVIVVMPDGEQFEVATFRSDSDSGDGRRPDSVSFEKTAKADASRRDFTINAMFVDPLTGEILDFFNGMKDLKSHKIRFIGDGLKRIEEDKLRMMRAARFSSNLGFIIELDSFIAIRESASLIKGVSSERVRDELVEILTGESPSRGIVLLESLSLLREILPDVSNMIGIEQPIESHPEGDVFKHTMCVLKNLKGESSNIMMAGLLHDIGKPAEAHEEVGASMAEEIMRDLKFSNEEIDEVVFCVRMHTLMHGFPDLRLSRKRILVESPYFPSLLKLTIADAKSSAKNDVSKLLSAVDEVLKIPRVPPLINGNDLIELGFSPGPIFGKVLGAVRVSQLDNEISSKEEAVIMATRLAKRLLLEM